MPVVLNFTIPVADEAPTDDDVFPVITVEANDVALVKSF